MNELKKTGLDNVFIAASEVGSKILATRNLVPGKEKYRIWDPHHSKLAAIISKGSSVPIGKASAVLYLGAANGTTVSHVSDIVSQGTVFAVEFSPRAMRDLVRISIPRKNLIPILADARNPGSYCNMVPGVDLIYQDVAQREQAEIAIRNARFFLKKNGFLVLIIKSRSIDSTRKASEVVHEEIRKLEYVFKVKEVLNLEPLHSGHAAVLAGWN
jgi:fibrillarin-like pre-rRNA processing protein